MDDFTQQPHPDSPLTPDEEFFRGRVERIVFRSEQTGFSVMKVQAESESVVSHSTGSTETLVAVIPLTVRAGTDFIARGCWQNHPKFGRQFKARSFVEADPTSAAAVIRYLGSGAIKGIGPVLAKRIVDALGPDTLKIVDADPRRLLDVPGVGPKKYDEIVTVWQEKRASREILLFFQNYEISSAIAHRIIRHFGARSIEVVRENPYLLCDEVWGIGFLTADRIAQSLGIAPDSAQRLLAGVRYCLQTASEDGHVFLTRDALVSKTARLLQLDDPSPLEGSVDQAVSEAAVIAENGRYYTPELFAAEERLASALVHFLRADAAPDISISESVSDAVARGPVPTRNSAIPTIRLSDQQQHAVRLAARSTLTVITGGPGCGKTTLVRALTDLFKRVGLRIRLAAPTGRAAQRLSEICDLEACTLHRLLRYDPQTRSFVHNESTPLELDVLVVDECSMIDLPLAAALFRAIPFGTRVVLVGDADQLPSVGPGLFFADLLGLDVVPCVRLTNLFRRANESLITTVAHQINSGEVPSIPQPDGVTKTDAYFLPAANPEDAAALVEKLVVEQIPKRFGFQTGDITVLSPMNQGEIGVISLNRRLQRRLRADQLGGPRVRVAELEFHLGDRVCQRVNNYNLGENGVFNGDQGEVIGIDAEAQTLYVRFWDGREILYPADCIGQLDLAYAISIHRSQGSEVPAVVLVLHDSHTVMLERQLLYTAITRAKKLLVIVGTRRALILAAKKTRSKRRQSSLIDRVHEKLPL